MGAFTFVFQHLQPLADPWQSTSSSTKQDIIGRGRCSSEFSVLLGQANSRKQLQHRAKVVLGDDVVTITNLENSLVPATQSLCSLVQQETGFSRAQL